MQIEVDSDRCVGSGACVLAAPEVFAQDAEGFVMVIDEDPPRAVQPKAMAAVRACPATVIRAEASPADVLVED